MEQVNSHGAGPQIGEKCLPVRDKKHNRESHHKSCNAADPPAEYAFDNSLSEKIVVVPSVKYLYGKGIKSGDTYDESGKKDYNSRREETKKVLLQFCEHIPVKVRSR